MVSPFRLVLSREIPRISLAAYRKLEDLVSEFSLCLLVGVSLTGYFHGVRRGTF